LKHEDSLKGEVAKKTPEGEKQEDLFKDGEAKRFLEGGK